MRIEVDEVTLSKYFSLAESALSKIELTIPDNSHLSGIAKDFLRMATDYVNDAKHFASSGDKVNAYGALNYAHGWLDAGARLGLFEVGGDWELFTLKD